MKAMDIHQKYKVHASLRLSNILDDVGVTEKLVNARKMTFLQIEAMQTIKSEVLGRNVTTYHFGSQTEGSTVSELGSDLDLLYCKDYINVMLKDDDWKPNMTNLLFIQDEATPPRHCRLQRIEKRPSANGVFSTARDQTQVKITPDHSLLLNTDIDLELYRHYHKDLQRHGPSRSFREGLDVIQAYSVATLPPVLEAWFSHHEKHPSFWPTPETVREAKSCGCFLIPVGHPASEYMHFEWRLSPSLIERKLMFSLTITHMKCYILLKMIKATFFKPVAGDELTSFHCKTALWFTAENTPKQLWRSQNLVLCVESCLRMLLRFLNEGFLPHYLIRDMNLFIGRLSRPVMVKLQAVISDLLKTCPVWVSAIDIEDIGTRFTAMPLHGVWVDLPSRHDNAMETVSWLSMQKHKHFHRTITLLLYEAVQENDENTVAIQKLTTVLQNLTYLTKHKSVVFQQVAKQLILHVRTTLASIEISDSIDRESNCVPISLLKVIGNSVNTDAASTKLKLASICFRFGLIRDTICILNDVEKQLNSPSIQDMCGFSIDFNEHPSEDFAQCEFLDFEKHSLYSSNIAYCVRFLRQEKNCAPTFFIFEMFRSLAGEEQMRETHEIWMDWAEVDAKAFLHYMQFLVCRETCLVTPMNAAFFKLIDFVDKCDNHFETSMNLSAHCLSLVNLKSGALYMLRESLSIFSINNAANWHVCLLLFLCVWDVLCGLDLFLLIKSRRIVPR